MFTIQFDNNVANGVSIEVATISGLYDAGIPGPISK